MKFDLLENNIKEDDLISMMEDIEELKPKLTEAFDLTEITYNHLEKINTMSIVDTENIESYNNIYFLRIDDYDLESFGIDRSTLIDTESIKNIFKRAWEFIKYIFKRLWEMIKAIFGFGYSSVNKAKKNAEDVQDMANDIKNKYDMDDLFFTKIENIVIINDMVNDFLDVNYIRRKFGVYALLGGTPNHLSAAYLDSSIWEDNFKFLSDALEEYLEETVEIMKEPIYRIKELQKKMVPYDKELDIEKYLIKINEFTDLFSSKLVLDNRYKQNTYMLLQNFFAAAEIEEDGILNTDIYNRIPQKMTMNMFLSATGFLDSIVFIKDYKVIYGKFFKADRLRMMGNVKPGKLLRYIPFVISKRQRSELLSKINNKKLNLTSLFDNESYFKYITTELDEDIDLEAKVFQLHKNYKGRRVEDFYYVYFANTFEFSDALSTKHFKVLVKNLDRLKRIGSVSKKNFVKILKNLDNEFREKEHKIDKIRDTVNEFVDILTNVMPYGYDYDEIDERYKKYGYKVLKVTDNPFLLKSTDYHILRTYLEATAAEILSNVMKPYIGLTMYYNALFSVTKSYLYAYRDAMLFVKEIFEDCNRDEEETERVLLQMKRDGRYKPEKNVKCDYEGLLKLYYEKYRKDS